MPGPIESYYRRAVTERAPIYCGPDALPPQPKRGFVILGDTQRTSRLEFVFRPHDAEQEALFAHLGANPPDLMMNVGDLVTWGPSRACWRRFDRLHASLRDAKVAVCPAIGNHDLMPFSRGGLDQIDRRFPFLERRRWYSLRYGDLAFVVLDSNFRKLGREQVRIQQAWFERTLETLSSDATVRGILTFWHHAPWTNSRVVAPSRETERRFVTPLQRTPKARAFFCGHSHAYEHFHEGSLHAFVTGGGGGPLQPLHTRTRRYEDRFAWRGNKRFLHYLHGEVTAATIVLECMRVTETLGIELTDRVEIELDATAA